MAAKRVQNAARQADAADGGLQIEADQRHLARHGAAVRDQLVLAGTSHGAEAQEHGVVAERAGDAGLGLGLRGLADDAGDHHQRAPRPVLRCLGCQLQHRAVEADIADLELRGVHADREPAGAGIDVIARKRALRGAIELTPFVERQGVRGDHGPAAQDGQDVGRQLAPVHATHVQPLARCLMPAQAPRAP